MVSIQLSRKFFNTFCAQKPCFIVSDSSAHAEKKELWTQKFERERAWNEKLLFAQLIESNGVGCCVKLSRFCCIAINLSAITSGVKMLLNKLRFNIFILCPMLAHYMEVRRVRKSYANPWTSFPPNALFHHLSLLQHLLQSSPSALKRLLKLLWQRRCWVWRW